MGINLGFENLGMAPKASGELSYEYLDSLIQFNQAASDVLDLCHELTATVRTYDNVNAISKCIKKYGVTRSLEALYGENFSSAASMEAENEEAKKGLGQKVKEIINWIVNKLKEFWRWMTDSGERAMRALQKAKFTGKFEYKRDFEGKGNPTTVTVSNGDQFNKESKDIFNAYDAAKRALNDAQQQLKSLQTKPNPSQEEVLGKKGTVEDAVKKVKAIVASANSFIAGSKKGKGGDNQGALTEGGSDKSDQTAQEENANK